MASSRPGATRPKPTNEQKFEAKPEKSEAICDDQRIVRNEKGGKTSKIGALPSRTRSPDKRTGHLQAKRVCEAERVTANVAVAVDIAAEPDGIELDVPADPRIVIPEVVVQRSGLLVRVGAGETEIAGKRSEATRVLIGDVASERIAVVPSPDRLSDLIRDDPRGVQMIGVSEFLGPLLYLGFRLQVKFWSQTGEIFAVQHTRLPRVHKSSQTNLLLLEEAEYQSKITRARG